MTSCSRTVFFWGAGATASLGFRLTECQASSLRELSPDPGKETQLCKRVCKALGNNVSTQWHQALCDLLTILGDREDANDRLDVVKIHGEQIEAMRRNWKTVDDDALRERIIELRNLYDWPALVTAINACPKVTTASRLSLQDLFNLLDLHLKSGHGFPDTNKDFLPPQRVLGARNALALLIQVMFYIDWHATARKKTDLQHHLGFACELGRRMQDEGKKIASGYDSDDFEQDQFIRGNVDFISLNWDPVDLWSQFVANRRLNNAENVPHVGNPARRLGLYHELGYIIAGPRVDKSHAGNRVWQPMGTSSARQLNDRKHGANLYIRVTNYLFPHGCLWWRECPNCGKLSSYIGDTWEIDSATVLPPPPLKTFVDNIPFKSWRENNEECERWKQGEVDARACVHCHTMTFAHHTPLVMQTNFKPDPPPFIDEIQREMRVVVQKAEHIILAGYSLPPDDVIYRAFFAARVGKNEDRASVRCSVIGKDNSCGNRWLYPDELKGKEEIFDKVKNAREIFGCENIRYFGGGIPNVFLDKHHASVCPDAVKRLLRWE